MMTLFAAVQLSRLLPKAGSVLPLSYGQPGHGHRHNGGGGQKLYGHCLHRHSHLVRKQSLVATVTLCRLTLPLLVHAFSFSPQPVDPDFVLKVEVYCSVPATEFHSSSLSVGKTSTPIKMLRKIRKVL